MTAGPQSAHSGPEAPSSKRSAVYTLRIEYAIRTRPIAVEHSTLNLPGDQWTPPTSPPLPPPSPQAALGLTEITSYFDTAADLG